MEQQIDLLNNVRLTCDDCYKDILLGEEKKYREDEGVWYLCEDCFEAKKEQQLSHV